MRYVFPLAQYSHLFIALQILKEGAVGVRHKQLKEQCRFKTESARQECDLYRCVFLKGIVASDDTALPEQDFLSLFHLV